MDKRNIAGLVFFGVILFAMSTTLYVPFAAKEAGASVFCDTDPKWEECMENEFNDFDFITSGTGTFGGATINGNLTVTDTIFQSGKSLNDTFYGINNPYGFLNNTFNQTYHDAAGYVHNNTFYKLDTSNNPLTGDMEITKNTPSIKLTNTGDSSQWADITYSGGTLGFNFHSINWLVFNSVGAEIQTGTSIYGMYMPDDNYIEFRDDALRISSPRDGWLNISADDVAVIDSPVTNMTGSATIDGNELNFTYYTGGDDDIFIRFPDDSGNLETVMYWDPEGSTFDFLKTIYSTQNIVLTDVTYSDTGISKTTGQYSITTSDPTNKGVVINNMLECNQNLGYADLKNYPLKNIGSANTDFDDSGNFNSQADINTTKTVNASLVRANTDCNATACWSRSDHTDRGYLTNGTDAEHPFILSDTMNLTMDTSSNIHYGDGSAAPQTLNLDCSIGHPAIPCYFNLQNMGTTIGQITTTGSSVSIKSVGSYGMSVGSTTGNTQLASFSGGNFSLLAGSSAVVKLHEASGGTLNPNRIELLGPLVFGNKSKSGPFSSYWLPTFWLDSNNPDLDFNIQNRTRDDLLTVDQAGGIHIKQFIQLTANTTAVCSGAGDDGKVWKDSADGELYYCDGGTTEQLSS